MKLTKKELLHIFIAWVVISLAFAWRGFSGFSQFLSYLPIVFIATGTGFIIHELAHKFMAMHYNCNARFFMWPSGLAFAIILALVTGGGFVFAAPGAVYIWGKDLTRKENGIISLAGPLSNLIVALIFLAILLLLIFIPGLTVSAFILSLIFTVINVNLFLGLFNLLPIPPLDGYKVLVWNKLIWVMSLIIFVSLFILLYYI